jgi:hypothetical protein
VSECRLVSIFSQDTSCPGLAISGDCLRRCRRSHPPSSLFRLYSEPPSPNVGYLFVPPSTSLGGTTSSTPLSSLPTLFSPRDSSQLTHSSHTSHRRHMRTLPPSHRPHELQRLISSILAVDLSFFVSFGGRRRYHTSSSIISPLSPRHAPDVCHLGPTRGEVTNLYIVIIGLLDEVTCRYRQNRHSCGAVDVYLLPGAVMISVLGLEVGCSARWASSHSLSP